MWDLVGNPEDRFSHNEAHIWVWWRSCTNSVTQIQQINLSSSELMNALNVIGKAVLEKKKFENDGHINVKSTRAGAYNPMGSKFRPFIQTFVPSLQGCFTWKIS